jgi:Zn-dependent alcohol dehydrogenase
VLCKCGIVQYRVIGIDISPDTLLEAKVQGAEHVFNPIKDKDYVQAIKQLTSRTLPLLMQQLQMSCAPMGYY